MGSTTGWIPGRATQRHLLSTVALVSGTPVTVTVEVEATGTALVGSDTESFTPRYGLTTHRKDLARRPLNWGTPGHVCLAVPPGRPSSIEYGSAAIATADPTGGWYTSLSAVPKMRYLYWRAWFIPSATQGRRSTGSTSRSMPRSPLVDKWGTTRDVPGLAAPWGIDPGEAVYGTRSMTVDCHGPGRKVYSYGIKVRAGRSYILTGLMKSQRQLGRALPAGGRSGHRPHGWWHRRCRSGRSSPTVLTDDREWFDTATRDVNRYRTPVWVATADVTVYVVLAGGWGQWRQGVVGCHQVGGEHGRHAVVAGCHRGHGHRRRWRADRRCSGRRVPLQGRGRAAARYGHGGPKGLSFADIEVKSPSAGILQIGGILQATALQIGTEKVARYVPITASTILSATTGTSNPGALIEVTAVPATGVTAITGYMRIRASGTTGSTLQVANYDNVVQAVVMATGVANRDSYSTFMAVPGGTNNRQIRYATVLGESCTYSIAVTGYWTTE